MICQLGGINVGHNAKAWHGQFSVCYKNTKSLLCKISLKLRPSQDLLKTLFLHREISNKQMPGAIILLNQGLVGQALLDRQSVTFNGLRPNVPSQYLPSTPNTHKYCICIRTPVFGQLWSLVRVIYNCYNTSAANRSIFRSTRTQLNDVAC